MYISILRRNANVFSTELTNDEGHLENITFINGTNVENVTL